MKILVVGLLMACGAAAQNSPADAACGSKYVAFSVRKDTSKHPSPAPENGKALVYLFGTGTLAIDGKAIGAVAGSYSVLEVDAGEHHLCARSSASSALGQWPRARSLHSLNAKAGETYYFQIVTRSYFPFKLELIDPDEGKYEVAKLPFSTSERK